MFDGIRKAVRPTQAKYAPLKSSAEEVINEKSKLMECLVEHYSELYGSVSSISHSALNQVESLPTLYELDVIPTKEELSEAIKVISTGKAPGLDGIPAEVFKCGGCKLLDALYLLLCKCWELGSVPQDMRDSSIKNLYKNKGEGFWISKRGLSCSVLDQTGSYSTQRVSEPRLKFVSICYATSYMLTMLLSLHTAKMSCRIYLSIFRALVRLSVL